MREQRNTSRYSEQPPTQVIWRRSAVAIFVVIGLYIILPQLSVFRQSLSILSIADLALILLALLATLCTYLAAALSYMLLAFHRLRFRRTLLMQFACMFVNRLLPGGIGGIGANYAYLRKSRHSTSQAASVVAVNNSLGAIGHLLVLATGVLFTHGRIGQIHITKPHLGLIGVLFGIAVIIVAALLLVRSPLKQRALTALRSLGKQLATYRRRPLRVLLALVTSIALTIGNVATFVCTAAAVNVHAGFVTLLIIFTLGVTLGTLTPTPGGLGGVEAGLVTGLVAYGTPAGTALAVVLLFRLVNYWIPLLLGAIALFVARRRHYF